MRWKTMRRKAAAFPGGQCREGLQLPNKTLSVRVDILMHRRFLQVSAQCHTHCRSRHRLMRPQGPMVPPTRGWTRLATEALLTLHVQPAVRTSQWQEGRGLWDAEQGTLPGPRPQSRGLTMQASTMAGEPLNLEWHIRHLIPHISATRLIPFFRKYIRGGANMKNTLCQPTGNFKVSQEKKTGSTHF